MQGAFSVLLITLGLGQLISTRWRWRAASLVGPHRLAGYGLGLGLLLGGAFILPNAWPVLWWALPAGPVALILLLLGGSYIAPPRHPDRLFGPEHPAHSHCELVQIPDGDELMPGYLLIPPRPAGRPEERTTLVADPAEAEKQGCGPAVLYIPGAGANKTSFKWRLIQALLAEGLTVLTIDPPGHGDYGHRPMAYPDGLSAVPAALNFLRNQPGVTRVGIVGLSMGGALAIRYLAQSRAGDGSADSPVEALVVLATPVVLKFRRALLYREAFNTFRSPILSLLREISIRQIRQIWIAGGYRSRHTTAEWLALLNPLEGIGRIEDIPLLLVYSRRDGIAPPEAAQAMLRAAPQADFLEAKNASHVALILMPEINEKVARWLSEQLTISN